ncbi:hypothetical protein [Embleya sp. NPDC059237]|uniref:hypothetical protein n=1 Tax=Embleya sp. NPDC059237 TaxID=3346784 RepID=UPI0036CB857F
MDMMSAARGAAHGEYRPSTAEEQQEWEAERLRPARHEQGDVMSRLDWEAVAEAFLVRDGKLARVAVRVWWEQ